MRHKQSVGAGIGATVRSAWMFLGARGVLKEVLTGQLVFTTR